MVYFFWTKKLISVCIHTVFLLLSYVFKTGSDVLYSGICTLKKLAVIFWRGALTWLLAHFHLAVFWRKKLASFTTIFIILEWKVKGKEWKQEDLNHKEKSLQMRSRKRQNYFIFFAAQVNHSYPWISTTRELLSLLKL